MGIYYHQSYSKARGTCNFGDDINPFLLGKLFDESIIDSKDVCLIGIGTIINDRELSRVDCYPRKVVFSSGVGYGSLDSSRFDDTWDFACVRGPLSAKALDLPEELAISDAGLLIPELLAISNEKVDKRYPVTFIPHVESDLSSGNGLQDLCKSLGIKYLSPRVESKEFVVEVIRSSKVITEAMHGAIIADAVRVPWVPVKFLVHEPFKWKDWCASVNLPYNVSDLGLEFWDNRRGNFSNFKNAWQLFKRSRVENALSKVNLSVEPLLSSDSIFEKRKNALWDVVRLINERYAK
ncbi:hypothetical protein C7H09_17630 [Marinobacter fuscus]|uniref:Polysaccharide pyruvyl transferase domain-containing protein n=1 Tax=Marinobacter fuscus TaxID=2109942 RepID=A0A2T1K3V7_9GAMM|nr:hypothetical protein [Marinobacter fuscus]PSF04846.1 hypothetical protein C7H09_17630 [Marinobacter fuscus]